MKASPELIGALRRAADRIAAPGQEHNWTVPARCNCGILAQEVGIPEVEIRWQLYGTWTERAREAAQCAVTGNPIREIWDSLLAAGFDFDDFQYIENLDHPTVLDRLGWTAQERYVGPGDHWVEYRCADQLAAAKYLRAQATLLEEELAARPSPSKPVAQPCVHNYVMDVCLYCCATKPVQQITDYANLPTH